MVDFKLPIGCHWTQSWEELLLVFVGHYVSWTPCFSFIFAWSLTSPSYFLLVLLGNIFRGNNPFSIWFFRGSSNASSRMPLLMLLILSLLSCSWCFELQSPRHVFVILTPAVGWTLLDWFCPCFICIFSFPLLFLMGHTKSLSLCFQHLLQWNLVFISLFTGNLKVMEGHLKVSVY